MGEGTSDISEACEGREVLVYHEGVESDVNEAVGITCRIQVKVIFRVGGWHTFLPLKVVEKSRFIRDLLILNPRNGRSW